MATTSGLTLVAKKAGGGCAGAASVARRLGATYKHHHRAPSNGPQLQPTSWLVRAACGEVDQGPPTPLSPLYESHVRTNPFQKAFIGAYAALTAIRDPTRGDMVAALGEATGAMALRRLQQMMRRDPIGRQLLKERPQITEATLNPDYLRTLPPGSFGREYMAFMDHHTYSADERTAVRFVDDPELAFIIQRYRQVHDFWHVLCGLPPTVLGELALKWFELFQTGLPVCAFSAVFGPMALSSEERTVLQRTYFPWALSAGRRAKPLMNVWYEKRFDVPVGTLRKELRIEVAPQPPGHYQ